MSDPTPPNHWESLIADLGATPPSEDESLRQPGPIQPPAPRTAKPASPRRSRQSADWDQIAGELGLSPPPPPPPPAPPAEPPRKREDSPIAPAEAPWQVTVTPERGEESPNFFDEKFDFEEPFDLLESAGGGTAAEGADRPAEKQPRRRRRRRRPAKGDEERRPREPAAEVKADREPPRRDVPAEGPPSTDERRSKHRRPRRGKGRRPDDERAPASVRAEPAEFEPAEPAGETDFLDDFDDAGADEERGERSVRAGFRGIPTWGEAVGMIIEKNLENRSKRPAGTPQRGRGNKRRS